MNWKWIGVGALFVIGILAGIVAGFWLTTPFHQLPAFIGGKHGRGRYRHRGEALIVFAVVVIGVAVYLSVRFRRQDSAAGVAAATPTGAAGQGESASAIVGSPTGVDAAPSSPEQAPAPDSP